MLELNIVLLCHSQILLVALIPCRHEKGPSLSASKWGGNSCRLAERGENGASNDLLWGLSTSPWTTVRQGLPSEPGRARVHVKQDVPGLQKWHTQNLASSLHRLPASVPAARAWEGSCASPHICVDAEALAAPDGSNPSLPALPPS